MQNAKAKMIVAINHVITKGHVCAVIEFSISLKHANSKMFVQKYRHV